MDYVLSHQEEFVKPTDIKIALTLLGEGMTCPIAFPLRDFLRATALIFGFRTDRPGVCRRPFTQETGLLVSACFHRELLLTLMLCFLSHCLATHHGGLVGSVSNDLCSRIYSTLRILHLALRKYVR